VGVRVGRGGAVVDINNTDMLHRTNEWGTWHQNELHDLHMGCGTHGCDPRLPGCPAGVRQRGQEPGGQEAAGLHRCGAMGAGGNGHPDVVCLVVEPHSAVCCCQRSLWCIPRVFHMCLPDGSHNG
jgi:hypothetical protein